MSILSKLPIQLLVINVHYINSSAFLLNSIKDLGLVRCKLV